MEEPGILPTLITATLPHAIGQCCDRNVCKRQRSHHSYDLRFIFTTTFGTGGVKRWVGATGCDLKRLLGMVLLQLVDFNAGVGIRWRRGYPSNCAQQFCGRLLSSLWSVQGGPIPRFEAA